MKLIEFITENIFIIMVTTAIIELILWVIPRFAHSKHNNAMGNACLITQAIGGIIAIVCVIVRIQSIFIL